MNLRLFSLRGSFAISIFLFVIVIPLNAATYYVDYANGNDNNNGLTTTFAFKHSPGDPLATGLAGSTILQAGDIVQFKSGVEYKGQVLLTKNGTSASFIEYRGQGWGTGRSTFNMEYLREYAFKGGVDYIKITGFNLYNYTSTGTDYVVYPTTGASNWIIDSVSIAYLKDWNSISVFPDKAAILLSNTTDHISISNSEFFANGRTTVRLRNVSYVTIKKCDFGGINRGSETGWFSVAIRGEVNSNNIHIEDNKFHDGWQYGGDQVPELNHAPAFIHIYGADATTHPYQIYIERNYFYNDKYFSTGTGTGTLEMESYVTDVYVRNNIFANACQYWGTQLLLASGCNNINIQNNTFIDRAYLTGYGVNSIKVYLNPDQIVGNNVNITNNIFWSDANSSGDCCVDFHGTGTFQGTIDHNAYFRSNSNKVNVFNDVVVSWSTWQGHGLDANSDLYNLTDPAFIYMPPTGATTSSGDYSVKPDAANLIDKGVTLPDFNDSYNGATRPQGAAWDLGAFEYLSAGGNNPPNQPSDPNPLNGSIDQPLDLNLSWTCSDPDGDPLTYDVYFGTSNNPPLVADNRTTTTYNPGQLNNNIKYYWKIVAKDNHGASTSGPIWSFNTIATVNNPPNAPSNPNPENGAINQSTYLILSWNCSDPDGDPLTYDVYFGNSVDPPIVSADQINTNFNPGQLTSNTLYYWKIIAKDNHSSATSGPVWNFTTLNPDTGGTMAIVNIKVLLEGPYEGNEMSTDLTNYSLVPLSQPYNITPWNYSGNEAVDAIPENVVDWILLELRTNTGVTSVIGKRAAFLRNDGQVVDLNGQPFVNFPGIDGGLYYVVIYHRNHLAIMSKNAILLSEATPLYDFTNSEDKAYGNLAMKSLGNGKYGLFAADGNGNGSVNNADYRNVWKKQNGLTGYEGGDFDMNGGVNIVDRNAKWKPNLGQTTRVPMN